jgi:hypothetical protein
VQSRLRDVANQAQPTVTAAKDLRELKRSVDAKEVRGSEREACARHCWASLSVACLAACSQSLPDCRWSVHCGLS